MYYISIRGTYQYHYLIIEALGTTISGIKRPIATSFSSFVERGRLSRFRVHHFSRQKGLFSNPKLPSMFIWWWHNGLFIFFCSLRYSVLTVPQFLNGYIMLHMQQPSHSKYCRPCSPPTLYSWPSESSEDWF